MDSLELRAVREDEFPAVVEIACVAFGEEATEEDATAWRAGFPFERSLCAFEDGKMVATSAVLSLELTLPGQATVPMGGITWIATLPTHRRRGLLRRLMLAQFADMAERGEVVSGLGSSEGDIYGRFGYGPATHFASFQLERPHAALVSATNGATNCTTDDLTEGRITLLDAAEAAKQLPEIYDRFRLRQPGAVSRPSSWWGEYLPDSPYNRRGAGKMYHCVHETVPGIADGYVSYRVKGEWTSEMPANEVRVVELVAGNPTVYRALWEYLANTDLAGTVSCPRGRVDEPLRWLLADPRRFKVNTLADFLWLRLLDVPRALAARAYSATGELVIEVTEEFPGPSRTAYALRVVSLAAQGADCAETSSEPDLALGTDALAAAYLGGVTFATLAGAGRVQELRTGAIAHADAMFSSGSAPYCVTEF